VKILVRATNWVGDAVISIPALEAIRNLRREAEIVILGYPAVIDLYREQGFADRLFAYEHRGSHQGVWGRERLAGKLRRERFDTVLLLQNAFDAAWLAWRAGIPERIGYSRDARSWLLTRPIAVPNDGESPAHEAYYYLELLRRAGWIEKLPVLERIGLGVTELAREAARQRLIEAGARPGAPWIAIAPVASYGGMEGVKCWPAERYAALSDRLTTTFGAQMIFFGAPPEREIAEGIARAMRQPAVNMVGKTSMTELPALLAACQLFIGNDSGATHVAGAAGLPIVGIFGPTDPQRTGPLTPRCTPVLQPVSCGPCFLQQCPVDHRCMTRVSVEQVFAAARAWLDGTSGAESAETGRKRVV
jgi:lipopolysaccharide heptosyltransferase II